MKPRTLIIDGIGAIAIAESILTFKLALSIVLFLYYWWLWQLDHHASFHVWKFKGTYVDGWIFMKICPELFEITSFYNFCIVWLLILPIVLVML